MRDLYDIQCFPGPFQAVESRVSPRKCFLRSRSQCEGRGFDPLPLHQYAQALSLNSAVPASGLRETIVRPVCPSRAVVRRDHPAPVDLRPRSNTGRLLGAPAPEPSAPISISQALRAWRTSHPTPEHP